MKSLTGIRRRCRSANDVNWYDRMYALQIAMAGYLDYLHGEGGPLIVRQGLQGDNQGAADIPDYPLLDPGDAPKGVQNHMLINTRINIQSVVNVKPRLHLSLEDPTEREVNEKWFYNRWEMGGWNDKQYLAGLNVETNALGWVVVGPNSHPEGLARSNGTESRVDVKFVDILDMLFDRGYKTPSEWRFICYRERVPIDDAIEQYGHIINQDIASGGPEKRRKLNEQFGIPELTHLPDHQLNEEEIWDFFSSLCSKRVDPLSNQTLETLTSPFGQSSNVNDNINDLVLHVWHYWDKDHHVCFLCSIDGPKSIPIAYGPMAGEGSPSNYQVCTESGLNPYGIIPGAVWIDSWAPGILRPTAKSETVFRLTSLLNDIEVLISRAVKRAVPFIAINSIVDDEMRKQWRNIVEGKDVDALFENTSGGSLEKFLERFPVAELPQMWMEVRAVLKQEIDAATGVPSPSRGQPWSGGEKTRKEATDLVNMGSVQARHLRNQYAIFLINLVRVVRRVGQIIDNLPGKLFLDDGAVKIGKGGFDMSQFLDGDVPCEIDPTELLFKPQEEIQAEVLAFLEKIALPFIQMGQANPRKVAVYIIRKWGIRNEETILFSMKEMLQNQQAKQQAAMAMKEGLKSSISVQADKLPPKAMLKWLVKEGLLDPQDAVGPGADAMTKHVMDTAGQLHDKAHERAILELQHAHEQEMERIRSEASQQQESAAA